MLRYCGVALQTTGPPCKYSYIFSRNRHFMTPQFLTRKNHQKEPLSLTIGANELTLHKYYVQK